MTKLFVKKSEEKVVKCWLIQFSNWINETRKNYTPEQILMMIWWFLEWKSRWRESFYTEDEENSYL